NPFSSHPNPGFDPTRPISPSNPQVIRDPFPGNIIPANLMSSVATTFLQKYVPAPNLMAGMGMGMSMMGAPTVVGAGNDSNNYLDVRNERHITDQGTMRVDHSFAGGDSLAGRYSLGSENGFMPQN